MRSIGLCLADAGFSSSHHTKTFETHAPSFGWITQAITTYKPQVLDAGQILAC